LFSVVAKHFKIPQRRLEKTENQEKQDTEETNIGQNQ